MKGNMWGGNRFYLMSKAVKVAYTCGEEEECMGPICLVDKDKGPIGRISDGDYVIFYDIRGEREIELTDAFTQPEFDKFQIDPELKTHWVTMIEYHPDLNVKVAFPPVGQIEMTLSEVLSRAGLRQIKIAESEKSIHVTYFMNGRRNEAFQGEDRVIIPSTCNIKNFDESPQMKCADVAELVINYLKGAEYDFICANLANIDVVGHTENRTAIIKAIETVDYNVGRIVRAAVKEGVFTIITADHGTAERWYYPDGKIDTGHTDSPVPFIFVAPKGYENAEIGKDGGSLIDIAPTIIRLFSLHVPDIMSGEVLIKNALPKNKDCRILLLIMDGWGYNPSSKGNLIFEAKTREVDRLLKEYPSTYLSASGESVGLPHGTVGNSESGHLHIGSGRVIASDRVRIENAMRDGEFYKNSRLLWAVKGAKRDCKNLHLLGIVSFFSSHGSIEYLYCLMEMAKKEGLERVFIHSLLGRRGERPESGAYYIRQIEEKAREIGIGRVVSVIGRYWALDREHNWDRIEKTYKLLVKGEGRGAIDDLIST